MKFLTALNRKNADLYNYNRGSWTLAVLALGMITGGVVGTVAEHLAKNPR